MNKEYEREERRRIRRVQRNRERQRRRRRQAFICKVVFAAAAVLLCFVLFIVIKKVWNSTGSTDKAALADSGQRLWTETRARMSSQADSQNVNLENNDPGEAEDSGVDQQIYQYTVAENVLELGDDVTSSHIIFVDTESDTVLAAKDAYSRMVPASMTKVLTLLVAVEHITDFDDTFTITLDITDYSFRNGCSCAGFDRDETVTIKDLLYGTVLPSGADAALGLAVYVSGSQEAFVELMNQKLEELGLSETAHFTNCVGIYDENHYCTAYDMAVIMDAAIQNDICREVLSARTYKTSLTEQHPEGIDLSNWFVRRIEDKETGSVMVYGKTGYVDESGSCAVSFGAVDEDRVYICVTTNASSRWTCINEQAMLYQRFTG